MIILFSKKINNHFQLILENYLKEYSKDLDINELNKFVCPHCGDSSFINWGYYTRNINYIGNNILEYKIIRIKRIKCKNCDCTHALIPMFIIPYKINLLDVILSSIIKIESLIVFLSIYIPPVDNGFKI